MSNPRQRIEMARSIEASLLTGVSEVVNKAMREAIQGATKTLMARTAEPKSRSDTAKPGNISHVQ